MQLQEMTLEKETNLSQLNDVITQKEEIERQLAELKARHDVGKDENDGGSTSPEIIPSNYSFGSSDIQVCNVYTSNIQAVIHVSTGR